jgi:hypothetical protein
MAMDDFVSATVWIKNPNGKYDGIMVGNNGSLLELGKTLFTKWTSRDIVKKHIDNGSVKAVRPDGDVERWDDNEVLIFRDLGISTLKIMAKGYCEGAYTYVFADGEWMFGAGDKARPLKNLLMFIDK